MSELNTGIGAVLQELRGHYDRPLPMRVFGVEHRELSHNRILHWILDGNVGPDAATVLTEKILHACSQQETEYHERFETVLKRGLRVVGCEYQPWAGGKDRPDELVIIRYGQDVLPAALLLEMKCQADPDAGQLKRYVDKATAEVPGHMVLPVMIHLAEPPIVARELKYPVVSLSQMLDFLRATPGDSASETYRVVSEYADVLEFLYLRDMAVTEHAEAFGRFYSQENKQPDGFERWLLQQRPWVQRRVLELVKRRLDGAWEPGIMSDPNGAFLDFHPTGLGCYEDGFEDKVGAFYFFKWRMGLGFEAHVIAWPYGSTPAKRSADALKALFDEGVKSIKESRSGQRGDIQFLGRPKNSGMVFRERNSTYGVDAVLDHIQRSVAEYGPVLETVAARVAERLGLRRR